MKAGPLQIEKRTESAKIRVRPRSPRHLGKRPYRLDEPISGVDINTGVSIGDGRVAFGTRLCHLTIEPNFCPLWLREMTLLAVSMLGRQLRARCGEVPCG